MQSFMKRLVQDRDSLSKLEEQVLDYIIRFPDQIVAFTLTEAANAMFISTATVSRTCKKLGFQGYQDFKLQLQLYLQIDHKVHPSSLSANLEYDVKRYKQDMLAVLERIDEAKLATAAKMIAKANYIEWFGMGHSYPVCWDGSKKLQLLGKKSTAQSDWDNLRSATGNLTRQDMAIFVSYSGETLHMVEFAHLVRERETPIISFVGTADNRIADLSDLVFYTPIENHYINDVDLTFRGPFQLLVDLMLIEYERYRSK